MEAIQNTAELLLARKRRILADITKHEQAAERHSAAANQLRSQLSDIEVAERVLTGLGVLSEKDSTVEIEAGDSSSVQKPEGIPSMPDMIKETLETAHSAGSPGLEPVGMLSYIQGKWWQQATTTSVGPIAWRMWKRGELVKDGPRYALPNAESYYLSNRSDEADKRELFR